MCPTREGASIDHTMNQRQTKAQVTGELIIMVLKPKAGLERGIARLAARQGAYRDMSDLYPKLLMAHCEHHDAFALPREGVPALIVAILHECMDLMTRLAERLKK